MSVVGWSVAATLSLVAVAYVGVPAIADRLAPLVPAPIERKLGDAVDMQMRGMLDTKHMGAGFECGTAATERPGRAALDKLVHRLAAAAALSVQLRTIVVRRREANAMALPGGRIYRVSRPDRQSRQCRRGGRRDRARDRPLAHRDGTKSVLEAGGLSLLFGMLLGDFVGGGAVVIAAKTVLQSSYSRKVEAAADVYGADLMNKAGGDARALAVILGKIGGATEPGMKILLDHPETKARVAAINRLAAARPTAPLLDASEWAALQRICAGRIWCDDLPSTMSRCRNWLVRPAEPVRVRGGRALGHYFALRPAGDRAGAGDLRRGPGFRRAGDPAGLRELCRDLAAGSFRPRLLFARPFPRAAAARLSGLSRLSRQHAAGDQ